MDRLNDEVFDLGAASIETKGPPVPLHDSAGGISPNTGISDE